MARVRRVSLDERADLAHSRWIVSRRDHQRRDGELPESRRSGRRRRARLDSRRERIRVGCGEPQLAHQVVGAERRPDLEVDRHRRIDVVRLLRGLVRGVLLLGHRTAVVAGERGCDSGDRPAALRRGERGVERDAAAEREADERGARHRQLVEQGDDVVDERERSRGAGRPAVEALVEADRPEPLGEREELRLPEARVAEARRGSAPRPARHRPPRTRAGLRSPQPSAWRDDSLRPWTSSMFSSSAPARWAAGSHRSWPRPAGGSRSTTRRPERSTAVSRRCARA